MELTGLAPAEQDGGTGEICRSTLLFSDATIKKIALTLPIAVCQKTAGGVAGVAWSRSNIGMEHPCS